MASNFLKLVMWPFIFHNIIDEQQVSVHELVEIVLPWYKFLEIIHIWLQILAKTRKPSTPTSGRASTMSRGRRGTSSLSGDGVLLTSTKGVVYWWCGIRQNSPQSHQHAFRWGSRAQGPGEGLPYLLGSWVKELLSGRARGVDQTRLEIRKALDVVGLSCLTRLCNVA